MLVDDQPAPLIGDAFERNLELRAAVAAQAVEHVAGQALGVNPHQGRRTDLDIPHLQNHGFFAAAGVHPLESVDSKLAEARREIGFGHLLQPKRRGCLVHEVRGQRAAKPLLP